MHIRGSILSHAIRGGTVLAMVSGAVVGIAAPSFAATLTVTPTKGPAAGTQTIVVSGATFAAGAAVEFQTAATCSTTYAAPAASTVIVASSATVNSPATTMNVVVPALTTGTSYNVCAYVGSTAGTSAQSAVTTGKPYAAVAASTAATVNPVTGSILGGNTVTLTDTTTGFGPGSAVEFNTATCPTTYTATSGSTVVAATGGTVGGSGTTLTVTVPANTLTSTAPYYVCAYTGTSVATSTLVSGTSAAAYTATTLIAAPNKGPAAGTNSITLTDPNATFSGVSAVEFQSSACAATYTTPSATVVAGTVTGFTTTTLTVTVPALTAGSWYACVYNGTTVGTSALASGQLAAGYTTAAPGTLTLAPTRGLSDGGVTLTATDASAAFGASTAVEFQTAGTCPVTYTAAGAGVVTATATSTNLAPTVLNLTQPAMPASTYSVCAYTGTTVGTSALISKANAAYQVFGVLTPSSTTGPSAGGNSITVSTSSGTFLAGTAVIFEPHAATACPTTYDNTGIVASSRVLTTTKLAVTVPAGVTTGAGPDFNICAYTGTSNGVSPLIAATTAAYTVAPSATISTVSPSAGTSQGGTVITVTGQNLSGITAATVGGLALTGITPISSTAFQATTPAHVPGGPFAITVTTAGGTTTKVAAFTYANAIVVTPNKAAHTAPVDLDVQGTGFQGISFTATDGTMPDDPSGHVYLVQGVYDPRPLITGFKAQDQLLECVNVLVISDNELVCTMNLQGSNGARPAWRVQTPLTDATIAQGSDSLSSPTDAAFTPADIGLTVAGTGIPNGTTIVQVLSGTQAVLSAKATAAINAGAATLIPPHTTTATNTITLAAPSTVTNVGAVFAPSDVGQTVTGTGIQPGTTITSVTNANKTITLSQPATAAAAANLALTIGNPAVPNGSYTVTVVSDGSLNAQASPVYTQSVVSSGSTFTVADF